MTAEPSAAVPVPVQATVRLPLVALGAADAAACEGDACVVPVALLASTPHASGPSSS